MNENALQKIEPQTELPAIVQAPITPAQAKIDAVANLTMKAYERASTLKLTPEEIEALKADFPDEAFQPGAAGKENLIYIEHAHLRDRLNQVFGPGQWAIVPRNRWAEDFTTGKGSEASRVYVEAMLCIRGCFVAEAVGEMEYWKNNASQNYGDAVEGAKTAALRRCAKELGIGLQAWKKDWCKGWWDRRNNNRTATDNVTARQSTAKVPHGTKPSAPKQATAKTRDWFLAEMRKSFTEQQILMWAMDSSPAYLLTTERLDDFPLEKVPTSREQLERMAKSCAHFSGLDRTTSPHDAPQDSPDDLSNPEFQEPINDPDVNFGHSGSQSNDSPQYDENGDLIETVTGKLEAVSVKQGRSKKGPWTRYGLRIGQDFWVNTFSDTLGKLAQQDKGSMVTVSYKSGERGNDLVAIERARKD